ncbi:MAG: ABC transporter permease [Spirochaetia bacterium]
MRQLMQILKMDISLSFKSFMGAYMIIAPVFILIIINAFLPSVENTEVTIAAVTEGEYAVPAETLEILENVANVEEYASIEAMEQKLRNTGSAEGLYWDPRENQFVSVMERSLENNEYFSYAARFIRLDYLETNFPDSESLTVFEAEVPHELSERTETSPIATIGGSAFLVFMVIVSGFLIGLNIVNDKEEGTDRAIRVSPVTKAEYFLGKSIFPFLILIFYTLISLFTLGLSCVNILQVYIVVIGAYSVTLLLGLLMGSIARNETEALGLGKVLSILLLLAVLGAALLPDAWQFIIWWLPTYWIFDSLELVFTETATWIGTIWRTLVLCGLSGLYALLLGKKIKAGLS